MSLTITEALAELKVIDKRLNSKREFVGQYVLRQEALKDPLVSQGGSAEAIRRELQAASDLHERKLAIRRAIQEANSQVLLTLDGESRSIADWLVWKREVGPILIQFYRSLLTAIHQKRQQGLKEGRQFAQAGQPADLKPTDIIVNVDEGALNKLVEGLEAKLETLDGKLSLLNAITVLGV